MSSYFIDRVRSGEWLAATKDFPAKFPGRCVLCREPIDVGDEQAKLMRTTRTKASLVYSAWAHAACRKAAGIWAFQGKS